MPALPTFQEKGHHHDKAHPLNIIWPGDYGIHFHSDTLVAGKEFIHKNPQLVVRFLRATLKGWRDAVGDMDAAVGATMKYARIQDEALQKAMMEAQLPLVHTGEDPIGWMQKKQWREMRGTLQEQGVIAVSPSHGLELFILRPADGLVSFSTSKKQEEKQLDRQPFFVFGKSRTHVQNVYYSMFLQQAAMTISTPIRNKQGELVAVLAGHLNLAELSEIMEQGRTFNQTLDT